MDIILKHFNICSIGYDCSIKRFISQYIDCELNVFDYIGTPMWSINELILNNFNDITNINYFNKKINYNSKYSISFIHDHHDILTFNTFIEKYDRRIERFIKLLNTKCIYFRKNETNINDETIIKFQKYNIKELEHIKEFTKNINNSIVIYFTQFNETSFLEDNNIIIIKYVGDLNWNNCIDKYDELINNNIDFIIKCLKIDIIL